MLHPFSSLASTSKVALRSGYGSSNILPTTLWKQPEGHRNQIFEIILRKEGIVGRWSWEPWGMLHKKSAN